MGRTAWPTAEEVGAVLPSGISTAAADSYVAAAVAKVEDGTGFRPFLRDEAPTTRQFPPPDGRSGKSLLDLKAGVRSITEIKVDVYDEGSGTIVYQGSEWNPMPTEAPDRNRPYTRIQFGRLWGDMQASSLALNYEIRNLVSNPWVTVTGTWGFGEIPEDLWDAVREWAAGRCVKQAQVLGPVKRQKQGDREQELQASQTWTALAHGETQLNDAISKYRRLF